MIKNRTKEKGSIARKAKGRGKIVMEITKNMKENLQDTIFCQINYSRCRVWDNIPHISLERFATTHTLNKSTAQQQWMEMST